MRRLLACSALALVGCATATPANPGDDDDIIPVDAARTDARIDAAPAIDAAIDAPGQQTITLTQAGNPTVAAQVSVACTDTATGVTRENSYYRVFRLADFGINRPFTPTMVSFGIEQATAGTGVSQPVQVRLYTLSGAFQLANLTAVAGNNATVPNSGISQINVPISPQPTIPATATLVAEVFVPDALGIGHIFFVGANNGTETAPGYLRAPMCNITAPTTYAGVGFPNVRLVLSVTGTY